MVKCPKCRSKQTWLHHNLKNGLWHSWCGRCGYKSEPTRHQSKADKWEPQHEMFSGRGMMESLERQQMLEIIKEKNEEIRSLRPVVLERDKQIERLQRKINEQSAEIGGMAQENTEADTVIESLREQVNKVIELIEKYGWIDGGHHKQWVLDQIIRILVDDYEKWRDEFMTNEDDPSDPYCEWDKGIAP